MSDKLTEQEIEWVDLYDRLTSTHKRFLSEEEFKKQYLGEFKPTDDSLPPTNKENDND